MATDTSDINPQVALGLPAWLDFDTLRSAAIGYLGPVTGNLWTDYNAHDPGITTLEALIYALLDLGYRTHLPLKDILARDPAQQGPDPDFFTPAQILGCNPLTILDYRKLLMDVEGVRNAWLEVVTPGPTTPNGLYNVYIELEQTPDDFTTLAEYADYQQHVLCLIRQTLMAHRNLCEDFYTVYFLCDIDVGVCAEIDLVPGADPGACYQELITRLYEFFSPVPTFYTLQQLLAKKKPIEAIFAGRPYPGSSSHGFLDTDELKAIVRRTEIHVSDVYKKILSVSCVQRIRKLQLRLCPEGGPAKELAPSCWVLSLPANTLPVLSIPCGGFQFFQNGKPLSVDLSAYNSLLELNLSNNGKVLYPADSPYLDAAIPTGLFRSDLGDYLSIQNDFPQVYGIGPGSLPANAQPLRIFQARQFKGFLLFFDQLLADYLAQLGHIRDLFSLSPATAAADAHTYFIGDLSSVPDLDALLRFPGTDSNGPAPGTALAYPVAAADWANISTQTSISCQDLTALTPFSFASANGRNTSTEQLAIDLAYTTPPTMTWLVTGTNRYIYSITLPGYDYVLLSQTDFPDAISAAQQAALILFLGQDLKNYSRINTAGAGSYGFVLNQSGNSYLQYLQNILEDGERFRQRRKSFLDHLLARFAEVFTDYALLYLGDTQSAVFEQDQINAIELFLSQYPSLSANRGLAMNYLRPGWNDNNTSGLEQRFKAYAGIKDRTRHHLCNFEVVQREPGFLITLALEGEEWFASKTSFAKEESEAAVTSLAGALGWIGNYQVVQLPDDGQYALDVRFYEASIARSSKRWATAEAAKNDAIAMAQLWSSFVREPDVRISRYEYHPVVLDSDGQMVRFSKQAYSSEEEARSHLTDSLAKPQDASVWEYPADTPSIGMLLQNKQEARTHQYLDVKGFNINADDDVPNQPGRWRFKVLDNQNAFTLHSIEDFPLEEEALEACIRFLYGLAERVSYGVKQDEDTGLYRVLITINGKAEAISDSYFIYRNRGAAIEAGEKILAKARVFVYEVAIRPVPDRWRFYYTLGPSAAEALTLESVSEYTSPEAAGDAVREFVANSKTWKLSAKGKAPALSLAPVEKKEGIAGRPFDSSDDKETQREKVKRLATLKQQINSLIDGDTATVATMIVPDAKTKAGLWVYRLVDKDHPKARCPRGMKTEADAVALRKDLNIAARKRYPFLEICLGGDRLVRGTGKDTPAAPWYFQIKCRNHYFESRGIPGRDIVLFESMQGYDSPLEAQTAFTAQYLDILKLGMDPANYGAGKPISLDERGNIQVHSSPQGMIPQVLVPKHSQHQLGIMGKDPVTELSLACKTYPIRRVILPPVIDPCDTAPADADPCDCSNAAPPQLPVYGFILFNMDTGVIDWESIGTFDTPETAMEAFYFFLMLLAWPGNLFIREDEYDCLYYVKIREVLAESVNTYLHQHAAWAAVNIFIGAAQDPHGFHRFVRQDNCSNSFWVGCPDCRLIHPCKYDTPAKRDTAQHKLYAGYLAFKNRNWLAGFEKEADRNGSGIIYDIDGQPLAVITPGNSKQGDPILDRLLDIVDAAWTDVFYKTDKEGPILVDAGGLTLARAVSGGVEMHHWKKGIQTWVQYFPLSRKISEKGGVISRSYQFSVKLPDFPGLQQEPPYYMPCGCGPEPTPGNTTCYTAWKNELVYSDAASAYTDYADAFKTLADISVYRSVFDCCCSSFGIEICTASNILVINPQSYYLPDEACAAIERAKNLINAEGLELIEHILLRPCPNEKGIPVCPPDSDCASTWADINSQGALQSPPLVPFTPGLDPYSFIVTVALPAWPVRFSKPENRLLLESILQREAPAHILLRILWLTPHDMCRFEGFYKKWIFWLGGQTVCSGYDRQAFLDFLFNRRFDCWEQPPVCCPKQQPTPTTPCWVTEKTPPLTEISQDWLSEINHLYCWADMTCADPAIPEVKKPVPVSAAKKANPPAVPDEKEKIRLVNMRLNRYRKQVQEAGSVRHEELMKKTLAFMSGLQPTPKAFQKLGEELAAAIKRARKSSRDELHTMAENFVRYWLDINYLKDGTPATPEEVREALQQTGLPPDEAASFYRRWNPEE